MFPTPVQPHRRPRPTPSSGFARIALAIAVAGAPLRVVAAEAAATDSTAANAVTAAVKADPLDPAAAVPPLVHRSSLADYRPPAAAERLPWREANDRVGRIGGWRSYLREAHAPDPAADHGEHRHEAAPPAAPAPPAPPAPPSR